MRSTDGVLNIGKCLYPRVRERTQTLGLDAQSYTEEDIENALFETWG